MTYDGRELRVFCDGVQAASKEIGKKRTAGDGPLAIGRRPEGRCTRSPEEGSAGPLILLLFIS